MAGSLMAFVYLDDNGESYIVNIDKSNANLAGAGFTAATQADIDGFPQLPKTLKMRYVNVQSASGIKRRIYVGSVTAGIWTRDTTTVTLTVNTGTGSSQVVFTVRSRIGEKESYLRAGESGQTDAAIT